MMRIRRAAERGHFDHGWLDTRHTFSFGDYYDPDHMGFRALRVLNEDFVAPGAGFPMHGHRDMEIVTIVLEGALEHQDSMGNGSVLRPGELQRMSAGAGIMHSEFNPSRTERVHLYQIWLLPDRKGHQPSYEQKPVANSSANGHWRLAASSDGRDGSLTIHQDAILYLAKLDPASNLQREIAPGRHGWLQVLRGEIAMNGANLTAGDGVAISDEPHFAVTANTAAELLFFDLK